MQWDNSENAGFTSGKPWINVNFNYSEINAVKALEDENSIFYYYKKLIQLRKTYDIFVEGDYQLLFEGDNNIFAYTRRLNHQVLLILCNFYGNEVGFKFPEEFMGEKELLICNYRNSLQDRLHPYEARIYLVRNE